MPNTNWNLTRVRDIQLSMSGQHRWLYNHLDFNDLWNTLKVNTPIRLNLEVTLKTLMPLTIILLSSWLPVILKIPLPSSLIFLIPNLMKIIKEQSPSKVINTKVVLSVSYSVHDRRQAMKNGQTLEYVHQSHKFGQCNGNRIRYYSLQHAWPCIGEGQVRKIKWYQPSWRLMLLVDYSNAKCDLEFRKKQLHLNFSSDANK